MSQQRHQPTTVKYQVKQAKQQSSIMSADENNKE